MPHPECSLCCTAIPPTLPNDFPDTTPDAMALSSLYGPSRFSERVTSGAESASHALFAPDV